MSSSPAVQIDPSSVDTQGVSVATTTPNTSNPREGTAYSLTMPAAAPIHFHPLSDGTFLMLLGRTWLPATPVGGQVGVFSSYTENLAPSWVILNGPSGQVTPVPGSSTIPMNTTATNVTLVAAASRPPNLLFVLSAATVNSSPQAVLQRFHVNSSNSVALAMEEVLPVAYFWEKSTDSSITITNSPLAPPVDPVGAFTWSLSNSVVFNQGLQYATPNLVLYGTDTDSNLYKISKQWGKVGQNTQQTATIPKNTGGTSFLGGITGWQYFTGTGLSSNISDLGAIPNLSSSGPLSFGTTTNSTIMATVSLSGSDYSAQLWRSRSGQPYASFGSPVPLGSSSDGSYLGGTMQLQPQLLANPTATAMTAAGVVSGIPYVINQRTGTSGAYSLSTAWNLLALTG